VKPASGPAASSSGLPCAQITSLRTSLTKLGHTTVSASSASQLSADLANVEKQLTALKGQASGAFSAQASQLSSALSQIGKDAQNLVKSPSSANLTALTGSVQKLKTTAQPMIKEMEAACP
jgi:septal ring factor EnvC (AmiA/AmiB activator)